MSRRRSPSSPPTRRASSPARPSTSTAACWPRRRCSGSRSGRPETPLPPLPRPRERESSVDQSFGIKLPGLVPAYANALRDIPALAAEFERLGFDDVMDGEHILYAAQMSHPGGAGNFEHSRVEQHSDRWDTLVMFAAIAARTTRLRLVSGIILAAAHTYAVLARQAATLDSVSGGRFTLGVGGGWNAAEFAALGIPPSERAARSEETIRACRELWSP